LEEFVGSSPAQGGEGGQARARINLLVAKEPKEKWRVITCSGLHEKEKNANFHDRGKNGGPTYAWETDQNTITIGRGFQVDEGTINKAQD